MMLKILKRVPAFLFAMLLLCNVYAEAIDVYDSNSDVTPHYEVISLIDSKLEINRTGKATCKAQVHTSSNFSVTLTCDLYKDGTVIKSWTASGKGSAFLDKSWYVTSGSDYQVVASATVYNSTGNYIDSGTAYSDVVSY